MKKAFATVFLCSLFFNLHAQNATVTGTIRDLRSQELLPGVNIVIENSDPLIGTYSDSAGYFKISAPPGSYNITATFVGYKSSTKFNILFTSGNVNSVNFELEEAQTTLNEVVVTAGRTAEVATIETPLSIQRLTTEEIRSNPGGNFDISRVIQALPGVGGSTGSAGFRNDIIIRGGAPSENVYYLDGIEIPVINHFSTQGSAGGPQGILNVSFIEDVTLSTSAFDSRYDNVLSSVLQFKQRDGNAERLQGNIRLSATELATTFDGPINKRTTFLASARRSYLKFIFKLIDLPIRPDYWDFQFKVNHKLNSKTSFSVLGVGAIDRFKFAIPDKSTPENTYIIRSNPLINQDSYAVGTSLKRLFNGGFFNVALSRNFLDNRLDKFEDATKPVESQRTLKIRSQEIENKIRLDATKFSNDWKFSFGLLGNFVQFSNDAFNVVRREIRDENDVVVQPEVVYEYSSNLDFFRGGAFLQFSRKFGAVSISGGTRTDFNSFTSDGFNLAKTLSPRISISYALSPTWNLNASWGKYFKLPAYTTLGFQSQGDYVNKRADYISSIHYVAGVEFLPQSSLRFTLEGFYKQYDNYPVSVRDGISLANTGTSFGQIGSEPIKSIGEGRSYGLEIFAQQKLTRKSFFTISYTIFNSEFSGSNGKFIASSWNNQSLLSAIYGLKLRRNWELGLKFRYAGGSPYTPFDLQASRVNYLSIGEGVADNSKLNSERLDAFKQVDFRIDKKWNFKRCTFDLYLDIQNITRFKSPGSLTYTFKRTPDNSDFATTDGNAVQQDGSNAIPVILKDDEPSFLPTIGFIIEF